MKKSAGILVFRKKRILELFLVHPGGPFWGKKDNNSWSIPKGEIKENEDILETALREFKEETGVDLYKDKEKIFYLGEFKSNYKILYVFAIEKDLKNIKIKSNILEINWPPYSNKKIKIPEIDKGGYFDIETAKEKLVNYQKPIIDELKTYLQN
jgi:predicted NUDIX family NTP pyrophosphohydrolase